jgi:hypothetical protein
LKVLFNSEEVAEVYFEYINRHIDAEQTEAECPLEFHSDLIRKTATQISRTRTPIWRGVKIISFSLDKDIFQYEGIDAKGKKIATVIIPFVQVNSIQTCSRKIRKSNTKAQMQTLNPKELENWR